MHRYLFGLDGTLTDPAELQVRQYALVYFGQAERRLRRSLLYIRPRAMESLKPAGLSGRKRCWRWKIPGERVSGRVCLKIRFIPSVEKLLWTLRDLGRSAGGGYLRPEVFAKEILGHFGLSEDIFRSHGQRAGRHPWTRQVIKEAFTLRLALEEADKPLTAKAIWRPGSMILIGAKKNGAHCFRRNLAFGYAEEGELEETGADPDRGFSLAHCQALAGMVRRTGGVMEQNSWKQDVKGWCCWCWPPTPA